jgi:hypothetical protein
MMKKRQLEWIHCSEIGNFRVIQTVTVETIESFEWLYTVEWIFWRCLVQYLEFGWKTTIYRRCPSLDEHFELEQTSFQDVCTLSQDGPLICSMFYTSVNIHTEGT